MQIYRRARLVPPVISHRASASATPAAPSSSIATSVSRSSGETRGTHVTSQTPVTEPLTSSLPSNSFPSVSPYSAPTMTSTPSPNSPSVVGPVVGSIAGLVIVSAVIFFFVRRKLASRRVVDRHSSFGRHYDDPNAMDGTTFGDPSASNPWGISPAASSSVATGLGAAADATKRYSHRRSVPDNYRSSSQYEGGQHRQQSPTTPPMAQNGQSSFSPYASPRSPNQQQGGYNQRPPLPQAAYVPDPYSPPPQSGYSNVPPQGGYPNARNQGGYSNVPPQGGYTNPPQPGYSNGMYQPQSGDLGDFGSPTMGYMDPAYNSHVAYNDFVYGNNGAFANPGQGSHEHAAQAAYYSQGVHIEPENDGMAERPLGTEKHLAPMEQPLAKSLNHPPQQDQQLTNASRSFGAGTPLSGSSRGPYPTTTPSPMPSSSPNAQTSIPYPDVSERHPEEQLTEEIEPEEKAKEEEDGNAYGVYGGLELSAYGFPSEEQNLKGKKPPVPGLPLPVPHGTGDGRITNSELDFSNDLR